MLVLRTNHSDFKWANRLCLKYFLSLTSICILCGWPVKIDQLKSHVCVSAWWNMWGLYSQSLQMQLPERIHRKQLSAKAFLALSQRSAFVKSGLGFVNNKLDRLLCSKFFLPVTATEACGPESTCINRPDGSGYDCRCHLGISGNKCMDGKVQYIF